MESRLIAPPLNAPPLVVLDTPALFYRAFYALPATLVDSAGTPINAVRGLLDTVASLIDDLGSSRIVAAFDADWRPAFRTAVIPEYKAQRVRDQDAGTEMPEELSVQIPLITSSLQAAGIAVAEVPGTEADDVIASLVKQTTGDVVIVSSDRDLLALLDAAGRVSVRRPKPKGVWETVTAADLPGLYGIDTPARYRELAALRGDPSDGLPGVPGIGEKTAATLLNAYGSLDSLFVSARAGATGNGLSPRRSAALLDNEDLVKRTVEVMTCVEDLDVSDFAAAANGTVRRLDSDSLLRLGQEHNLRGSAARLADSLIRVRHDYGTQPRDAGVSGPADEMQATAAQSHPPESQSDPRGGMMDAAAASSQPGAPPVLDSPVPSTTEPPSTTELPSSVQAPPNALLPWHHGTVWGFDLETTGVDPTTARIVSAAVVEFHNGTFVESRSWLADPGIEIPQAAVNVHGISTQKARDEGADRTQVVREICALFAQIKADAQSLVGHNIVYDLTVLENECLRLGVSPTVKDIHPPIVDTLVMDRQAEKYRRGPRVLGKLAERWGVTLDNAHDAAADARAAVEIAIAIARSTPLIGDAPGHQLHDQQIVWKAQQSADLEKYLRGSRDPNARINRGWPFEA